MSERIFDLGGKEWPEFIEIATRLAELVDVLPGPDTLERQTLRRLASTLRADPSNPGAGQRPALMALFGLTRPPSGMVDCPETWLLAGCFAVASLAKMQREAEVKMAQPLVKEGRRQRRH